MAFKDIIGQERAVRILTGTLARDRVPSAVVLTGDAGIGKRQAALFYAKALNCLQPAGNDCCDICPSCRKIESGVHPDVFALDPGNDEIKIDAIRKVEEILSMKPYEGKKKVVIINDADAMNIYAANAFLKTLEEPPSDSLILLITSNPDSLPDTIRSRCMNVKFRPLPAGKCMQILAAHPGTTDTGLALNLAMGRPGLALSRDFAKEKEWFLKLLKAMLSGESKEGWTDKAEIRLWLDMSLVLLRDMAVHNTTGKRPDLLLGEINGAEERGCGGKQNAKTEVFLKAVLESYQSFDKIKGLLDFNLNKSITWNYVSGIMRDFCRN